MRVKVVGMKRFDGEVEGREYHQTTLHCIEKDVMQDGLMGDRVTTVKVKDAINPPPFEIGSEYLIFYGQPNSRGHADVEFIQKYTK